MSKSVILPLNPKAAEAVRAAKAERSLDLNDLNNLAGWDADAQFSAARAKLKLLPGVSIFHQFIGKGGTILHEFFYTKA